MPTSRKWRPSFLRLRRPLPLSAKYPTSKVPQSKRLNMSKRSLIRPISCLHGQNALNKTLSARQWAARFRMKLRKLERLY